MKRVSSFSGSVRSFWHGGWLSCALIGVMQMVVVTQSAVAQNITHVGFTAEWDRQACGGDDAAAIGDLYLEVLAYAGDTLPRRGNHPSGWVGAAVYSFAISAKPGLNAIDDLKQLRVSFELADTTPETPIPARRFPLSEVRRVWLRMEHIQNQSLHDNLYLKDIAATYQTSLPGTGEFGRVSGKTHMVGPKARSNWQCPVGEHMVLLYEK